MKTDQASRTAAPQVLSNASKKRPRRKVPFNAERALAFARERIASPPSELHVKRPEPIGVLIAEFALPPEHCKPGNHTRHRSIGSNAGTKKKLWDHIRKQFHDQGLKDSMVLPLPGRPQVLCSRHTANPVDKYADWAKAAVDMLQFPKKRKKTINKKTGAFVMVTPKHRVGIISDDKQESIDLHQWWEPAKRADGVVYIRVFSGVQS